MKQREAFNIYYKFLHFTQTSLTHLREIGQNYGSMECARCNKADEYINIFIYLLCLLE